MAAKITGQAILLGHDHDFIWLIRQASDKSKPVDERMGFESIAHYHYRVYQLEISGVE